MSGKSFLVEAEARYREAVERREAIRDAWQKAGRELLAKGSTGQLVEHPLVKMLREHDVLVDRLAKAAEKAGGAHRGPMPSAVITPSIGKSPASKQRLRSVK